jgi:hypothetical protein
LQRLAAPSLFNTAVVPTTSRLYVLFDLCHTLLVHAAVASAATPSTPSVLNTDVALNHCTTLFLINTDVARNPITTLFFINSDVARNHITTLFLINTDVARNHITTPFLCNNAL